MDVNRDNFTILMADDDDEEAFLFKEGLEECNFNCDLRRVPDGKELMDYLLGRDKYADPKKDHRLLFILLDLNMPGIHGINVLIEIKSMPELMHIPVIVYTSSRDEEDVRQCYASGAAGYIIKPEGWEQLINMIKILFSYWARIVRLPEGELIPLPITSEA
ncbi:MAG: response regulator [Deltaproteobacteria bacterium]|nr:response regulator [Deltaproteobacteria bacterium]